MTVADKSYLVHVTRGGELLRADRVDEARAELERANQLRPSDARIMNLLGLTYFRSARYPEAQAIYADLVKRAPKDPALRLNLGLVHLKRGDVDDAIRELTRARELDPTQLRTMGYLGLAFARKGRYALARDAFHTAGQDELAKEMDQQLALEMKASEEENEGKPRPRRQTAASIRAVEAEALPIVAVPAPQAQGPSVTSLVAVLNPPPDITAQLAAVTAAASSTRPVRDAVTMPMAPVATLPAPAAEPVKLEPPILPGPGSGPTLTLASASLPARDAPTLPLRPIAAAGPAFVIPEGAQVENLAGFLKRRLIRPDGRDLPIEIAAGQAVVLRIHSRARLYARTAGVLVTGGQLSFEPVQRKTRARQTGEPFGQGEQAMSLVSGTGHLVALPRGGTFAAIALDGESIYLREDLVFAFEERLSWENGHVPGSNGGIPVVQLRGDGCLAVRSERPLFGIEVAGDRVVRVAASALAGWSGAVVPRVAGGEPATVECAGEGSLLVEEPR